MLRHNIDPIAFYLFDLPISWYWIFYPLSFFVVYLLSVAYLNAKKPGYNYRDFIDFITTMWFAVILGGRLGYFIFYHPRLLIESPTVVLEIWRGGMSFHGALLSCILAALLFRKIKNISIKDFASAVLLFLPFALFLGRIGNFINGELWGTPTNLPWAMIFPKADEIARHPSQIYEAILEGPILFLVLWYSRTKIPTVLGFMFFYGFFRFLSEFSREPDRHLGYFAGLSLGQYLCLAMMVVSTVLLLLPKRRTFNL